jgi:hypothetical protein
MRIKTIALSWFRGAAESVSLDPECNSMLVYGMNGAGKSSFVDAVEYTLDNGRIGHLAHEYSGKNLKNAVPNTHKPKNVSAELSIRLSDGSGITTKIKDDGSATSTGSVTGWDYRRTVLRQGEVVAFIQDTKGGKYSALLPLFGLHQMEIAAENLRQVTKNIESLSQLQQRRAALVQVNTKRRTTFGNDTDAQIIEKIELLHKKYCPDQSITDVASGSPEVVSAIGTRISALSADQKRHVALRAAAAVELKRHADAIRATSVALAGAIDPLISEKLAVLHPTAIFIAKLPDTESVQCPACGRLIQTHEFREHVVAEMEQLKTVRETFNARLVAMGALSDAVKRLKSELTKPDVQNWRDELAKGTLGEQFTYLDALNAERLRTVCGEVELQGIEKNLATLTSMATLDSLDVPASVEELLRDKETADIARSCIKSTNESAEIKGTENLVAYFKTLERSTREEIRLRSNDVINEISEDIKRMWSILHPEEAIENVRLYLPADVDKAIDIGLKFYGKELDSPRLTLSEGYRNSLGLCIFLAMAKREASNDRPVILDDVVVSLDREHRGMILELLEKEFADRQVIILTHDRDWYTELRLMLDPGKWIFKTLLPYQTPQIGIRWSHKTTTFDDARARLTDRPDSAGNDARKIMDIELAIVAEKLQMKLPYLRFDKNDRRMSHEFLERLGADGKKCFQRNTETGYVACEEAIQTLDEADRLLATWGNKASHSFDVVRPEATKLIDTCERALKSLKCTSCDKMVWFAHVSNSELLQCQCGGIRWKYGKA